MCGSGAVVCSLSLLIREAQACPLSGRNSTQRPVQILEAGSLTTSHPLVAVAFTLSFPADLVLPDQRGKHRDGRLILGVGPAGMGADRALIVLHRDHRIARATARYSLDAMDAAKRVG